jgi:hypothetical protein
VSSVGDTETRDTITTKKSGLACLGVTRVDCPFQPGDRTIGVVVVDPTLQFAQTSEVVHRPAVTALGGTLPPGHSAAWVVISYPTLPIQAVALIKPLVMDCDHVASGLVIHRSSVRTSGHLRAVYSNDS